VVLFLQRVGGSDALGVASLWLQWLLMMFVLARRRVESVIADFFPYLEMSVVSLSSARSPTG